MCRVSVPHAAAPSGLSRRTMLRGSAAAGLGLVAVAAASGCDSGPDPNQTTARALVPLAASALADAAAARALVPSETEYSAALGVVADQRAQHAQALREEITRLDQDLAATISSPGGTSAGASSTPPTPTGTAAASTDTPTPITTPDTLDSLRSTLTASARAARAAAVTLSGYSAGLAGSISASVTTLAEVQLA